MKSLPILVAVGISALYSETASGGEDGSPKGAELTRLVRQEDSLELSRISRFQGSLDSVRWKLIGLGEVPFDLVLDVYQVSGKTAMPLIKGEVIAEGIVSPDENAVEVSHALSDRDYRQRTSSFLFRLWCKRENKSRLVDTFLLKLEVPGMLEKLGDLTIFLEGEAAEQKWLTPLRAHGVKIVPLSSEVSEERVVGNSLLITEGGVFEASDSGRLRWKRVIRLDASSDSSEIKPVANDTGGWVLTIRPELLDTLEWDPELQRRFVGWFSEETVPAGKKAKE